MRSRGPALQQDLLPRFWTKTHPHALSSIAPASALRQTSQTGPALGRRLRTVTPADPQDPLSWCPRSPYSFSLPAATRAMGIATGGAGGWVAACSMAHPSASIRASTCRTTVAFTSTTARAQASAAPLRNWPPPCCLCPSSWTLRAWRTGLAVGGPTWCGKNGCSRPTQSLSSWGPGYLWTGQPAGSTMAPPLTATQTFVYTAKHYTTIRVGVSAVYL